MPSIQGAVGVQNNPDSSSLITSRMGKQGELSVSELHARYYEQSYRNNIFSIASQAVATTSVGLTTTYTGLVVANPLASGVNLVLNKASFMSSVINTTITGFGLAYGFSPTTAVTLTAAVTPQSTLIGSGKASKAVAATSATIPVAPLYGTFLGSDPTATTVATGGVFDLEGSVILAPGAYALFVSPAASQAGMWFAFQWEEVPI